MIEVVLNTIAKANTFRRPDVKTAILHLAGNPSEITGTIATVDPVIKTNHIKVQVQPWAVKTVEHLYSNHNSDATIILHLHRQYLLMAVQHHSSILHQMRLHPPHPPIQLASNTFRLDMAIIMMITDGVVEVESVIELVIEEIIMVVVRTFYLSP